VALRALFFCGVLLGSLWRLLRAAAAFLLALGVVSLGAGPGALDGALAVLEAGGPPGDAARLDLGPPTTDWPRRSRPSRSGSSSCGSRTS
jgi:hypothetical protein